MVTCTTVIEVEESSGDDSSGGSPEEQGSDVELDHLEMLEEAEYLDEGPPVDLDGLLLLVQEIRQRMDVALEGIGLLRVQVRQLRETVTQMCERRERSRQAQEKIEDECLATGLKVGFLMGVVATGVVGIGCVTMCALLKRN